jgi:predicted ferric reductase
MTLLSMIRIDGWGWLAIAIALAMGAVWAVRATRPEWITRWIRAVALARQMARDGRWRDEVVRRLVWAFAFIVVVTIWNGRRVVNAVIVPIWERIHHYGDLQNAAQNVFLSACATYAAYRVIRPP